MQSVQHTTSPPVEPSFDEIGGWFQRLLLLHQLLRPRFARPEVHQHVLLYLQAIISDIPRKNGIEPNLGFFRTFRAQQFEDGKNVEKMREGCDQSFACLCTLSNQLSLFVY